MTELECQAAIADRLEVAGLVSHKAEYLAVLIFEWMKHAAETAEVRVDLSTSGKVYKTYLRPGLPAEREQSE